MKRRHPLATLVKLAGLRERKARADVGVAAKVVEVKTTSLAARRNELLSMLADDRPIPAHLAAAMRLQGLATAELIELAATELHASERRLANDRRKWQEAAHDLDLKEELEQKRKREHAVLAAKAAERVLDEMMAARHPGRKQ